MKIVLIHMLIGILVCSKPSVSSYIETQNTLRLIVVCGKNKNGFIDINKEKNQVLYFFPCKWGNGGKGKTNLNNVVFYLKDNKLIMTHKGTKKNIFKIRCNAKEFNAVKLFINRS